MAPQLKNARIAFIGGGNMASAIIGGLLPKGISKDHIVVSEPYQPNRDKLAEKGVRTTASNDEASRDADVVILAVKPQVAKTVCEELGGSWAAAGRDRLPLVVSICAGITLASMAQWFGQGGRHPSPHVVRVMPNTPALVGEGATGLFASADVSEDEKSLASELLGSVSKATEWVGREELLDVVTALSGSGPAYFFALVEHLIESATRLGLPREQATRLAKQTCYGAGKMLVESSDEPSQLRQNVTSPNGTTHAALVAFDQAGLKQAVDDAVKAAAKRAEELGKN
ncbi:hypothetical protein VTK73DRAFT_7154 [Phialemonium thermophilum]|uniref:Pyrroline-5-carboxylate reductase n=1 Tax=Phialemonium thermophilum TaxID=223376 RepID=A0ABR3WG54_9PEZI